MQRLIDQSFSTDWRSIIRTMSIETCIYLYKHIQPTQACVPAAPSIFVPNLYILLGHIKTFHITLHYSRNLW